MAVERTRAQYLFQGVYIGISIKNYKSVWLNTKQYDVASTLFVDIYETWFYDEESINSLHAIYWLCKVYQMEFPERGVHKTIKFLDSTTLQEYEYDFAYICAVLNRPFVPLPWLADVPPYVPPPGRPAAAQSGLLR